MTSPYDRWKTTAPDCYEPYATATCRSCDEDYELSDFAELSFDAARGICRGCAQVGKKLEDFELDDETGDE